MSSARLARAALFILALSLAGCPKRIRSTAVLEKAASSAKGSAATARQLALAGFHALLVEGDAAGAASRFEAAVGRDPSEPYALYGLLLEARRRAHPERALHFALELCQRNPRHPLAAAGARALLDLAGVAVGMDDVLLQRAPALLAAGLRGDAAQLVRSAVATVQGSRGDGPAQSATLAQMGVPDRYRVAGPFFAHDLLPFDERTGPEKTGELVGPWPGPFGPVVPRELSFPDGRFSLGGEAPAGDGYVLATDLEVAEAGLYVVRTVTSAPHRVYLDGTQLYERRSFERATSTVAVQGVELLAGRHRLLVRMSRDDKTGTITPAVLRADGRPAAIKFHAARGSPPSWSGVPTAPVDAVFAQASDFAAALEPEVGEALALYLAARDGMGRDRDGAKRLAARLIAGVMHGREGPLPPALTALRADLALGDRTIPTKVARGRATRDLEATLERDRGDVASLLQSATLALEDGRHLEASDLLKQARGAHSPPGYPVAALQARVELALGVEAQAEQSAIEALAAQPGLCEALVLRYDLARRRDAGALADQLARELERCPGSLSRFAEHAKLRGDLATAATRYEALVARDPGHVPAVSALAGVYLAQRRHDDAARLLTGASALWPRNAALLKQLGDVYEFAGRKKDALAARERALQLDGGDLALRRSVERARTGKELLADHAIDAKRAISEYQASPGTEDAASAYVLDAAAVEVFPDGSMVDRIHIIQKALDQGGVSQVAEVTLPQTAYVLALRTIKADGTVLEPESIEGKDAISMPGVQVGDFVQYEYLQAHPSRGPGQPGFTAASFYFQIARQPNSWSTYKVLAPRGTRMLVDAHHMRAPPVRAEGDREVFFHEERKVPPYIPEPNAAPSGNEYLPFVTVGAGTTGNEGVVAAYADEFLDRGMLTEEVEAFARAAVGQREGMDAVQAVYAEVHRRLQGRDSGVTVSAASSVAQDRGSRLWLLKASLAAMGIPARLVAVRTFATDPAPYKLPNEALLPYLCVRAEVPGQGEVWLDPLVRFAPFGQLPEQAAGGREAYLLPEPGRPLQRVKTPPAQPSAGKEVKLSLALAADGKLSGTGEEVYGGFEAAQLAEALEALSADQRDQALQSALSRYFGGAELSSLRVELKREVGATLAVRYQFVAPHFGRLEGDRKMVLGSLTFPAWLGRRFVQLGTRKTALFIDASERSRTVAELQLPAGWSVVSPMPEVKSRSAWGEFTRTERVDGKKLVVEERYRLDLARVPPRDYEQFVAFAGEVDLIQGRDLLIERR